MEKFITTTFSRKFTIILSISIVTILTSQPFSDILRGILYAIAAIHAVITFFYLLYKKHRFCFSIGSIALVCFYLFTTIIFIIHNDIMSVGLTHLHILFFSLNCLFIDSSENIEAEIRNIAKLFIILGLYKILGSLVAWYIMKEVPYVIEYLPTAIAKVIQNSYKNPFRPNGLTVNPNTLGTIIAVSFWCSIFILFDTKEKKWEVLSILNILLGPLVGIRISSRTSLLVIVVFSIVFLELILLRWKKIEKRTKTLLITIIAIGLLFLICLIIIISSSQEAKDYFFNKILRMQSIKTATGRTELQKKALAATKNNRLFGISYIKLSKDILGGAAHTHNPFIQILVTAGIPTLLLFSIFIIYSLYCSFIISFKETKKNLFTRIFILSAEIALLLQSFFEQLLFANYGAIPFFAYSILSFSIVLYKNSKLREKKGLLHLHNNTK